MAMELLDEAHTIWNEQVPSQGQAETVQGELLRCVEKLRWEAQTNGNVNWDDQFELLAAFIEKTLEASGVFDAEAMSEILADIARLRDYEMPEASDDPYDRLSDRVVEYSRAQDGPVPHTPDRRLRR